MWSRARHPDRHCSICVMPTAMEPYLGHECLSGMGDSCRVGNRWRLTRDRPALKFMKWRQCGPNQRCATERLWCYSAHIGWCPESVNQPATKFYRNTCANESNAIPVVCPFFLQHSMPLTNDMSFPAVCCCLQMSRCTHIATGKAQQLHKLKYSISFRTVGTKFIHYCY